ncbi:MAG TPA: helix-hairpin-helix domain-containing protein [Chloroflexota bacterium]|nr:helix-hairpin-helix domain-containing protein [Chloroflexota bacterium]
MTDSSSGPAPHDAAERRTIETRLRKIPNVGPRIAADLVKLGILRLEDAAGRDPDELYATLCAADGVRHDPCVRDVFAAVVAHANGEPARPWWAFTAARKARDAATQAPIRSRTKPRDA